MDCLRVGRLGRKIGRDLAWGTVEKGPWLTIKAADSINQITRESRVSHTGGHSKAGWGLEASTVTGVLGGQRKVRGSE